MSPRRRLLLNLLLSIASLAFTFAVTEFAARLYLIEKAPRIIFDKYASIDQLSERYGRSRHTAHRYLVFSLKPSWESGLNRHNSRSFRGDELAVPKPEGVFRIVCLGGSTTYSASVEDYRGSYPNQLQTSLHAAGYTNVEVINAGVFSYTSWESLVTFETRVLELEPDLLIVYDGINDIDARMIWPPEAYTGDGVGYVQRLPVPEPSFWERSTVVRMVLVYFGWAEPHMALQRNFVDTPETYIGNLFQNQMKAGTYPSGLFREHSAEEILAANAPVYFERNLRILVGIADQYDIAVVFATFMASPHFSDNPRANSDIFQQGFAEHNAVLRAIADSTPAHLFDFAALMPTDPVYFSDGVHFSALGNQLRGELYAEFLIDQGLVLLP